MSTWQTRSLLLTRLTNLQRTIAHTSGDSHIIAALNFNLAADVLLEGLGHDEAQELRREFASLNSPHSDERLDLERLAQAAFREVYASAEKPAERSERENLRAAGVFQASA